MNALTYGNVTDSMNNKFKMAALAVLLSTVVLLNGCGKAEAVKTEGEIAEEVIPIPVEVRLVQKGSISSNFGWTCGAEESER